MLVLAGDDAEVFNAPAFPTADRYAAYLDDNYETYQTNFIDYISRDIKCCVLDTY